MIKSFGPTIFPFFSNVALIFVYNSAAWLSKPTISNGSRNLLYIFKVWSQHRMAIPPVYERNLPGLIQTVQKNLPDSHLLGVF
jgi:hypothetical protein